jgi:hypothetical protein
MRKELPRKRFTLEADLFIMHSYIKEKEDPRPYLPYVLMVVEAGSGMIVGHELMIAKPALEMVWAQAQVGLLTTITHLQGIPHRVAVRDERLHNLLIPVAAGLGIQLFVSHRLPALDEVRTTLEDWVG